MVLTKLPHDPLLDLDPWVGQRSASFAFRRINGVTGEVLSDLTPLRNGTLTHDTTRTIKRQLSLSLGTLDTSRINTISDRLDLYMVFASGVEYPLGRYMFSDDTRLVYTSGELASVVLHDEMFLVDQQIPTGISGLTKGITTVIEETLADLPVEFELEASGFTCGQAWSIGAHRGQILEALSVTGDYFSPWFGNDRKMHFIRTFDPATEIPDFDFDNGNKVWREQIMKSSDLLTAPDTFIVIGNIGSGVEVVGSAEVAPTAPHSKQNRGFSIVSTKNLQVTSQVQAQSVAQGLANRQTVFERVTLITPPDPRHDSYNVIHWQGDLWLELAWSMALVEGGAMSHLLRKAYTP